jgi:hypothetical protein
MSRPAQGSPSLLFNEYEVLFVVAKQLRCEANHSPHSGTEITNDWRYTSIPHICLHDADRENLTVLPYLGFLYNSKWVWRHGGNSTPLPSFIKFFCCLKKIFKKIGFNYLSIFLTAVVIMKEGSWHRPTQNCILRGEYVDLEGRT